jgi:peptide/nickel transport system permease protein
VRLGLILVFTIFLLSLLAPLIVGPQGLRFDLPSRLESPSRSHLLGTDENGVDVLAKILYGARLSLTVAIGVVGISTFIGLLLGTIAGFYNGVTESVLMRFIDMLQAFPGFLLALAVIAFMGSSITNMIFALCITGWTAYARLVRGEILSLKTREFVSAARATGVSNVEIITRHLWPNVMATLAVQMSFGLAGAVISEAGLSFLGLGASPSTPSWGALLSSGRKYLISDPWLSIFPGLAILTLVLGFNLIGDGLRQQLDPKSQAL